MNAPLNQVPSVAFLGVCDRVNHTKRISVLGEHDIIGLRNIVAALFFPFPLRGLHFAFAIFNPGKLTPIKIELIAPDKKIVSTFTMQTSPPAEDGGEPRKAGFAQYTAAALDGPASWLIAVCQLAENPTANIAEPGLYELVVSTEQCRLSTGWVQFALQTIPALTVERIAALKSNPLVYKSAHFELNCKLCDAGIKAYTALERDPKREARGQQWYCSRSA